jgi:hypothetical protein
MVCLDVVVKRVHLVTRVTRDHEGLLVLLDVWDHKDQPDAQGTEEILVVMVLTVLMAVMVLLEPTVPQALKVSKVPQE